MKTRIFAMVFIGLLLLAVAHNKKADHAASSLFVSKVLRAYNVFERANALAETVAEASRLSHPPDDPGSTLPRVFERRVTVSLNGTAFRREKHDAKGVAQQTVIGDGQVSYCSEMANGKPRGPAIRVGDWQFQGIKFDVMTFGVIPLLRQLQDSTTEAVYLGSTEQGQEKLAVKMASGIWTLFVDESHLIRKVEMVRREHFLTIEYDDYRTVARVQLPFSQRVFTHERLVYELVFTKYDLSPSLPSGYFSPTFVERGRSAERHQVISVSEAPLPSRLFCGSDRSSGSVLNRSRAMLECTLQGAEKSIDTTNC